MTGVDVATGDIERLENLHGASGSVFLTCPERSGGCMYDQGPDRPDDYALDDLLSKPFCPDCGCSLVVVSRAEYDGPEDEFHDLDTEGSPLL